jgi:hypothetical protein
MATSVYESWSGYLAKQQTLVVMGPRFRGGDAECVEAEY